MSRFDYLIEKIAKAPFQDVPFKHIEIKDFFNSDDFQEITSSAEVDLEPAESDKDLFESLFKTGYRIIQFPGCVTDKDEYMEWRKNGKPRARKYQKTTEGFGMTLRLTEPTSPLMTELRDFFASETFNQALAGKFDLDLDEMIVDNGIQKYLDGYEISPHPDNRRKACTFMVNINSGTRSEVRNHHTHYMKFKESYQYVPHFWAGNPDIQRCWVPWDWCETVKQQTENNSIVLFSPNDFSLHAVIADYDHLSGQRTQIYGNLFSKEKPNYSHQSWKRLDLVTEKVLPVGQGKTPNSKPKPKTQLGKLAAKLGFVKTSIATEKKKPKFNKDERAIRPRNQKH